MRERELKRQKLTPPAHVVESLPMRERELKRVARVGRAIGRCRSPCGSVN